MVASVRPNPFKIRQHELDSNADQVSLRELLSLAQPTEPKPNPTLTPTPPPKPKKETYAGAHTGRYRGYPYAGPGHHTHELL